MICSNYFVMIILCIWMGQILIMSSQKISTTRLHITFSLEGYTQELDCACSPSSVGSHL